MQQLGPASATAVTLAQRLRADGFTASEEAQSRVEAWLAEIEQPEIAGALRGLLTAHSAVSTLVAALSEYSPHLWDLIRPEPARLLGLLQADPDRHFAALLVAATAQVAATEDEADAMRLLRRMKSEAALLIGLADIGGAWPIMQVTRALTELADAAVDAAVRFLFADASRRGRFTSASPDGYIVLAMGKMGAFELNYSSDIDLIVFYDPEVAKLAPDVEPTQAFVRITRGLVKLLQERTGDGYVFRTDLRLRPDPASTQIAVSTPAALHYYESIGQNWERAAMIKARACAGDIAAGEDFLKQLAPFVWRKYLDFASVAAVHAMKRQIHAYRGHGEIAVEGHNVKLGRGGIREIEFFVQTQQLIAGGRHPGLRGRETLAMLAKLAEENWITFAARDDLSAAYQFLRSVEHRLQMVADEQTHTLPPDADGVERFARFLGFPGRDGFAEALVGHMHKVQQHYASLFESSSEAAAHQRVLSFPAQGDARETLDQLAEMGFRQPVEALALVRNWLAGGYRSLRPEAAREALTELLPVLIEQFARSESPDAAIVAFDQFLSNLHGASRLLSLLRQNSDLVSLLGTILGMAPRLADTLALLPQVMDAVIDPGFFGPLPEEENLAARFQASLGDSASYEDFLERIRVFAQEQMFLTGTRILSGTISSEQAGGAFARLADVLVRSLFNAVEENFSNQHGQLPRQESAILALGKLGGREMTATSDLDLIMVYDFDGEHAQSDGERPLQGSQYFARLTQRLISALTARTNYGVLYEVDMRLRPSGRSGPLATRIEGFAGYQEDEAWTWEHMALTRARVLSAPPAFAARVEDVIRGVLCRERDPQLLAADVVDMRRAIAAEKGDDNRWDLKYVAGGLVDIEFIAQYLQLAHAHRLPEVLDTSTARVLDKAWKLGLIPTEDAEVLRAGLRLYQNLTQILRLCLSAPFDPKVARRGLLGLLARAADMPDFTMLEAFVADSQVQVRNSFIKILGSAP